MPIEIPPSQEQDLLDRIARLQAENTQLNEAASKIQGRIDGVEPPAPGFQAEEDANEELYDQLEARTGLFFTEREALDGTAPSPPITTADIEDAAKNVRPSLFFPSGNVTIDPTRVTAVDGTGGTTAVNEAAEKVIELADIATLLGLPIGMRPGDPAFTSWVASLTAQSTLLATQITAGSANESYGAGHPDVLAAVAEKAAVDALLPTPPVDDGTLMARSAQATARAAAVTARAALLTTDVLPFSDDWFLVIRSRVRGDNGTLARIFQSEAAIVTIDGRIAMNDDLIAFYQSVIP